MSKPTDAPEQQTKVAVPEEQTTAEIAPAEEPTWFAWAAKPVLGGASVVQITMLLLIGAVWSGSIWLITDRIKDGLGMKKPYTQKQRMWLTFGPLIASVVLCLGAFPAALELTGVPFKWTPGVFVIGAVCGLVAWAAAKKSHDWWGKVLTAGTDSIINRIRGLGGNKVRGYTTDSAAVTDNKDEPEQ